MTTEQDIRRQIDEVREVLRTKELSPDDLDQLLQDLKAIVQRFEDNPELPMHSVMELQGLGKELWQSIDVDEYLKQERDSWR